MTYLPPIGIPSPSFGVEEVAPAVPNPWTSPVPGFYFVEPSNPSSTDTSNTYGTPGTPRKTIPNSLAAGSYVELRGSYATVHESPGGFHFNGTVGSPIWIRSGAALPTITGGWEMDGSYWILENLDFNTQASALQIISPTDHGAIRHSDISGTLTSGRLIIASYTANTVSDVVIWDNYIHHNGDVNAGFDQDFHGITVSKKVSNLWILDNVFFANSGDGIQINATSAAEQSALHHIYVGRNISHGNKQTGMWTKQADDVIFSQNECYDHIPSGSSSGAGMGGQYAPQRVWWLFNRIHGCDHGIHLASDSGLGNGTDHYAIGNVIWKIHDTNASRNPASGFTDGAFSFWGGTNTYFINNTIYDVDDCFVSPRQNGFIATENNIVGAVDIAGGGAHYFYEFVTIPNSASTTVKNSIVNGGTVKFKWGGTTYNSLAAFQSGTGKGENCLDSDPKFKDGASANFNLQASSPAINAGLLHAAYATFQSLYGIDITKDLLRVSRPQGAAWDMGAYEFTTTPSGIVRFWSPSS